MAHWGISMTANPWKLGEVYPLIQWERHFCTATVGIATLGLMTAIDARVCIEIGIWKGFMTQVLAWGLRNNGGGLLLSCDVYSSCCESGRQLGAVVGGITHSVICKNSRDVDWKAELAKHNETQACLAVIDGDHDYPAAKADTENVWPIIRPGGLMICHDYDPRWPGAVKAADEFHAAHKWNRFVIPPYAAVNGVGACVFQREESK